MGRAEQQLLEAKEGFHCALASWYEEVASAHPWRSTREPYHILVSEVMLQQTTVAAVLKGKRYEKFLAQYPDIQSLAGASDHDLLLAWEGLGYYQRARNLRATARAVLENHGGIFPQGLEELEALPGIGPYTAAALEAFAFGHPAPLVDANIARVFARLLNYRKAVDAPKTLRMFRSLALGLSPPCDATRHHNALMELGQKVCTARNPGCERCPVQSHCLAPDPASLPRKKHKPRMSTKDEHVLLVLNAARTQLLLARPESRLRQGLWRLPERSEEQTRHLRSIYKGSYQITRYKVRLRIYPCPEEAILKPLPGFDGEERFQSLTSLSKLPMPSPHRRATEKALAIVARENEPPVQKL